MRGRADSSNIALSGGRLRRDGFLASDRFAGELQHRVSRKLCECWVIETGDDSGAVEQCACARAAAAGQRAIGANELLHGHGDEELGASLYPNYQAPMKTDRLLRKKTQLFLTALFVLFPAFACLAQTSSPLPPDRQVPRPRVIVFVHGLHGNRDTWRAANGAYWPDLVRADPRFAYSDVEVAEYPTPASQGKMSSVQLADVLWTRLNQDHVWDHREVVFLAHSLGGILVEEMLLRHPNAAAQVKLIVSYGTPHEGSTVARVAALYDKDPLLVDLSDASDNTFLTQLESNWRGNDSVNRIHRFCAYEAEDTKPDNYFGRYLRTRARVVSYFSATYGCDVTTPPQEIRADHLNMVKPADRNSPAYDFFYRVYRDNPVREPRTVVRESIIPDLKADCDQTNANPDLPVAIALDPALREKVVTATASLIDAKDIREINPNPPVVAAIDPNGVAHVRYSFAGPSKKVFVCLAAGRASLKVDFFINQQVPIREPGN